MSFARTKTTESSGPAPAGGWIFYDRDCSSCSNLARRFGTLFARRGFAFEPLQAPWVQRELGLSAAELVSEMRVLMRNGNLFAGADAILVLTEQVWWMSPLTWVARVPRARPLLRVIYRWVAAHRTCTVHRERRHFTRARRLPLPVGLIAMPFVRPWAALTLICGCAAIRPLQLLFA